MKFLEYKYLIKSDLYRYTGKIKYSLLIKYIIFGGSYKYIFWMRTTKFTKSNLLLKYIFYPFAYVMLKRLTYKFGISIPASTEVGSGFYIGHFGGIVINEKCMIGKNLNISQGVTLGQANRGKNKGYPTIGDNVYIGPGAKIIGSVKIGNNVAIGANSVVTKDISDNSVVVGIPAKIISTDGTQGYINRTDYADFITV